MSGRWIKITLILAVVAAVASAEAPQDSVFVHLVNADRGVGEDGKLQVNLQWKVFVKKFDSRTGKYGEWVSAPDSFRGRFEVLTATDSAFSNVVRRAQTESTSYVIKGLDFGKHYWWKVNLVYPGLPSRSDFAEGVIYKHIPQRVEHKSGSAPWIRSRWVWVVFLAILFVLPLLAVGIVIVFLVVKLNKRSREEKVTT